MSPFELSASEGVRPGCGHRKREIALKFGELESTTHLLLHDGCMIPCQRNFWRRNWTLTAPSVTWLEVGSGQKESQCL